jgi:hypothetical protein
MKQENTSQPGAAPAWTAKFLAAVTTLVVLVAVLSHWKNFDLLKRGEAIALLFYVFIVPVAATWRRTQTRIEWSNLLPAYVFLLTATLVFAGK